MPKNVYNICVKITKVAPNPLEDPLEPHEWNVSAKTAVEVVSAIDDILRMRFSIGAEPNVHTSDNPKTHPRGGAH